MTRSLLIIEDELNIADIIREYLLDMFDKVYIAHTVDEAINYVSKEKFSVITLDINLNGRNGSEVVKYFLENPDCENAKTPIILISGMLTVNFIEKNKHHFAGILVKPFEMGMLRRIADESLSGKVSSHHAVEVKDFSELPKLKCQVPFTIAQLDERVEVVMKQVRKDPKMKKLFSSLKIHREPSSYISTHIGMLINISIAISMKLEWDTEKTLYKFVYAAYLHDIPLADRNDLAVIRTVEELRQKKKTMSPEDAKLVFEHPNIAATTLSSYVEIPVEVIAMVRQHHELPNEAGFPSKIGYQKFIPFSVVFIIAHDLTNHILANPEWNMKDYMEEAKLKFTGPLFVKTLKALEMVS